MPRYTYILNSFKSGELGPKLEARTDVNEYRNGLAKMENFVPYRSGGAFRRPGLITSDVISTTSYGELLRIPFETSEGFTAILEFKINSLTSNSDFTWISYIGSGQYTNVDGVAFGSSFLFKLRALDGRDDKLTNWHLAQKDDYLIMVHGSGLVPPIVVWQDIQDNGSGDIQYKYFCKFWDESNFGLGNPRSPDVLNTPQYFRIPFDDPNETTITMNLSTTAISTSGTITCSDPFFVDEHVGTYIMVDDNALQCTVQISGTSGTKLSPSTTASYTVVSVGSGYPASVTSDYWYESSWSTDLKGWPRSICINNQRLLFGGTEEAPQTLWASEQFFFPQFNRYLKFDLSDKSIGTYERVPSDNYDAPPLQLEIATNTYDEIRWLNSGKGLFVGTATKEYIAQIGTNNLSIEVQSYHGGISRASASGSNTVFFVSKTGRSVVSMTFSDDNGAYVATDLNVLNDDIIHEGTDNRLTRIDQIIWQESMSTLWCLLSNGKIIGVSMNRGTELRAWNKMIIDEAVVYHMFVVDSFDEKYTPLFIQASNDLIPDTEFSLQMADRFESSLLIPETSVAESSENAYFFDFSSLPIYQSSSATVSVPSYFDGTDVDVISYDEDGRLYVQEDVPASSGTITLEQPVVRSIVGYNYTSKIKTLDLEVGPNQLVNSQGDVVRVDRATWKLYKTWGGNYGAMDDAEVETLYRFEQMTGQEEFTGEERTDIPASPDDQNKVILESEGPYPLNVIGLILRGVNNP